MSCISRIISNENENENETDVEKQSEGRLKGEKLKQRDVYATMFGYIAKLERYMNQVRIYYVSRNCVAISKRGGSK